MHTQYCFHTAKIHIFSETAKYNTDTSSKDHREVIEGSPKGRMRRGKMGVIKKGARCGHPFECVIVLMCD